MRDIMDILEFMECAAECRLDEMIKGLPKGKFRCHCGKVDDLNNAMPSGPSPYSMPMCTECSKEIIRKHKNGL